ncbi:SDR family NAD(P)-dependent oxidoreductase [Fulvivirga sp. RKSG066]|uniref:SDR family NAD(P)-dependent oxidoreductase n=1 Tax=Fulvivirga aurantia TaxID=2529383 RepID=UPI0012BC21E2|nr:SDR family NAD(P)-dependent oxidoreductase [Fulvivirga aurantia]MTI21030.1 SDR family NAD(P)-dependent oxidoreductase [Fulvivirga aurantia]
MQKRIALITGATSGIGLATARLLAKNNFDLVICGRRTDRLDDIATELKAITNVHTASFDVRDKEKVQEAINNLPTGFKKIDVLVNNAGNAHGLSPVQEGDVDDWDAMIDINVKGLLYVSKAVLPIMLRNDSGHIVNIGSIAGKEVYPNGNVYCASKHAVDAINNGMRLDLNGTGVRVSAINPGLVETEFSMVRFKGDETRSKAVYEGYKALQAEDIAETILFVITRPNHVNISDMVVFPSAQASSTIVDKSGK